VSYDFHLPVIWIYQAVEIVTFGFFFLRGGCAAFYLVARFLFGVCLLLTRDLLWLVGAFLPVDLQVLAA
jgi:hypothetical protein